MDGGDEREKPSWVKVESRKICCKVRVAHWDGDMGIKGEDQGDRIEWNGGRWTKRETMW